MNDFVLNLVVTSLADGDDGEAVIPAVDRCVFWLEVT